MTCRWQYQVWVTCTTQDITSSRTNNILTEFYRYAKKPLNAAVIYFLWKKDIEIFRKLPFFSLCIVVIVDVVVVVVAVVVVVVVVVVFVVLFFLPTAQRHVISSIRYQQCY